ncbi:MAG: hypothetical protein R3Y13_05295 [bacterium]
MNYYFEVELNFLNEYCNQYEWLKSDNIKKYKKVLILKISNKDLMNFYKYDVNIEKELQGSIVEIKQNEYLNMILTDGTTSIAIQVDDNYTVNKCSSMKFCDELNIEEIVCKLNCSEIKYNILKKKKQIKNRKLTNIKNTFINKIDELNQKNEKYLLQYIYKEIFNKKESNIEIITNEIKRTCNKDVTFLLKVIDMIEFDINNI